MRFCANISWLFTEVPSLEARYEAARKAGFTGVEFATPFHVPLEKLVQHKEASGLQQVLLNACAGDASQGDRGLCALPHRQADFERELQMAHSYAKALKCSKIHIMAGSVEEGSNLANMEATYIKNLQQAGDLLAKDNIMVVIEGINPSLVKNYFVDSPSKAVEIVKKVNHPNVKVMLDLFHAQMTEGNLTQNIDKYYPYIGHVQAAQVPDRGELDSSGEVNYDYVLAHLKTLGYTDWVGLEYKPKGSTLEGLSGSKIVTSEYLS